MSGVVSPTIASLDVVPIDIPYKHPVIWAEGRLESGDHVLIRLATDDGKTVWTEAIPRTGLYGETQATILSIVREVLTSRLVGEELWDWTLQDRLRAGITNNHVAIGAVEQAIICLRSRHLDVYPRDLLGGGPAEVPVSWMLSLGSLEEMITEAAVVHRAGYRSFKVKGGIDPGFDIELFKELSAALPDSELYIDANQGYGWREALRVCTELAPLGLKYLEEPLPIAHPNRRELSLRTGVGILGDDSVKTLADGVREMTSRGIQAISIKLPRTGVRDSMRLAAIAASLGIPVVMGSQGESAVGTFVNAHFAAAMVPHGLRATELVHFEVFAGQATTILPTVVDGMLAVESLDWDTLVTEESVARYHVTDS